MSALVSGDREVALGYERFPDELRDRIRARMQRIVDRLESASRDAAPYKTGKLKSEIHGRVYADNPQRVAGYVQVTAAGGGSDEYRKAGALEYGVNKSRSIAGRLAGRNLVSRLRSQRVRDRLINSPIHQRAYRYLRGPLDEMRGEIEAEMTEAIGEATQQGSS
jgi:hypothetical protein